MSAVATYPSENSARQAMLASGIAEEMVLLIGRAVHDTRRKLVGGFAGPVAPDDLVGSYASRPRERRGGSGSFAGDADKMRQGCFADTDRVVVVTKKDGTERSRVTGEAGVWKLLRRAALSEDAIRRVIAELRAGLAVMLVSGNVVAPTATEAQLEDVREAA
jgi:hypothetical protein